MNNMRPATAEVQFQRLIQNKQKRLFKKAMQLQKKEQITSQLNVKLEEILKKSEVKEKGMQDRAQEQQYEREDMLEERKKKHSNSEMLQTSLEFTEFIRSLLVSR